MSRPLPPCALLVLAALLTALVAVRPAAAASDSAEAAWQGDWRPADNCPSRDALPLTITVEGEKLTGNIGREGSFVGTMDQTGRVTARGAIGGGMSFGVRGRRQGERIDGRFTGFYDDGDRQCDGVFEAKLVPPPEEPAVSVAPPPEPQEVAPEPEPEPEPQPEPTAPAEAATAMPAPEPPPSAVAAVTAPAIPRTMPRPEPPPTVDPGDLPANLDADTRARMARLAQLLEQGLITQPEYETKRRQLLATAGTAAAPAGGASAPAPGGPLAERLQQLDAMRAQGLIGEREYQVLSRRIQAETGDVDVAAAVPPAPPPPPPPQPAPDTAETTFLRLFYNFCMLRIDDLTRIRTLGTQYGWQPFPDNYKRAYRPSEARDFDGWVLGAGQSVLTIHETTRAGGPANVCAMIMASGPDAERLSERIAAHFAPKLLEDRYEGRQRFRRYAITLPELGDMEVALIHGDDPARPAVNLSVVYGPR